MGHIDVKFVDYTHLTHPLTHSLSPHPRITRKSEPRRVLGNSFSNRRRQGLGYNGPALLMWLYSNQTRPDQTRPGVDKMPICVLGYLSSGRGTRRVLFCPVCPLVNNGGQHGTVATVQGAEGPGGSLRTALHGLIVAIIGRRHYAESSSSCAVDVEQTGCRSVVNRY